MVFICCIVAIKAPPFSAPDENAHYLRSLEVSKGQFYNTKSDTGVMMPCEEYLVIAEKYAPLAFFQEKAQKDLQVPDCSVSSTNSAGTYPPVPYIASATGINIGEIFDSTVETKMKIGRLFNAFFTTLICLISVLMVKKHRILLTALCSIPSCLWVRSSLSADAITISICVFFLAFVIKLKEQKTEPSNTDLFVIFLTALLLGASKPVYALFSLTALILISNDAPKEKRIYVGLMTITITFMALCLGFLLTYFANKDLIYINYINGADPKLQLQYIFNHPVEIFNVVSNTISSSSLAFVNHLIFPTVSYHDWIPYENSLFLSGVMLAVLFVCSATSPDKLYFIDRFILYSISYLILVAVILPLYITYTLVGFDQAIGVQGRYFIPIFFLLVLALRGMAGMSFLSSKFQIYLCLYLPVFINIVLCTRYLM